MKQTVFWIVAAAILLNGATVALSIVRPDQRVWPPPRRDSWQYVYNGVMSFTGLLGLVALGLLDWNSFAFHYWTRFLVGGLLMACGLFALWGYLTLGAHASQGLGGPLVTTGPYRYSRNPQYVGTIPAVLGYAILCNSTLALVTALLLAGWFVLVPFAEESWCREQLGAEYEEYARKVPRFLGLPRPRDRSALCLLLATSFTVGCGRVHDAWRFFLSRCPADGPVPETNLQLHLEKIDVTRYYGELRSLADPHPIEELARVEADGGALPIYRIGPIGSFPARRILVVAGVHGNEIAGSLAGPEILRDARGRSEDYEGCELHLIAPANPVGLVHQSRYNARGCDINRDFGALRTPEARALRDAFFRVKPTLVVALHEGPQDGFYVVATRPTPPSIPEAVAQAVRSAGVALSSRSFIGSRLRDAGYEHEGAVKTLLKRLIRLHTLGSFAERRDVGTLTTESPWSSSDVEARVRGHVAAVRAVCAANPPRSPAREQ